jgi:peptidoglycan/LPS O-acetylase OafA/YrhL
MLTKRNVALDSLRGIAALGILVWHYQHFNILGRFESPFETELLFFYKFGWIFVDFFFCLSGYVFFAKYFDLISTQQISLSNYLVLRLSRLYPLIVLTLFVTAVLNYFLKISTGTFFIYQNNDFFAFFANLLFLQSGFFYQEHSFNAPTWSLGIEFWLYILFFWLTVKFKDRFFLPLLCSLIAFASYNHQPAIGVVPFTTEFERGIGGFFLGGVVYSIQSSLNSQSTRIREIFGWGALAIAMSGILLIYAKLSGRASSLMTHDFLAFVLIISPLLVMSCSVSPSIIRLLSNPLLEFFGDISYSMYLWHVSVQLMLFTMGVYFGYSVDPGNHLFFFAYLMIVVFVSYQSSKYFEKPMQVFIRNRFIHSG